MRSTSLCSISFLSCPICKHALTRSATDFFCENNHHFDLAKEGYVNLLPAQFKHSKNPGDTPESLKARRAFLSTGFYTPLQTALTEKLTALKIKSLVDIGCGEGFYTQALSEKIDYVVGIDIAKTAVQMASKQSAKNKNNLQFAVATSAHLPIQTNAVDACASIFAPIPVAECVRILKENGVLIVVTPAINHLQTLREALFETLVPHDPRKFLSVLNDDFELKSEHEVSSPFTLNQDALKQLIAMTPYGYKVKPSRREAVEANISFETTAVFQIYILQKRTLAE